MCQFREPLVQLQPVRCWQADFRAESKASRRQSKPREPLGVARRWRESFRPGREQDTTRGACISSCLNKDEIEDILSHEPSLSDEKKHGEKPPGESDEKSSEDDRPAGDS